MKEIIKYGKKIVEAHLTHSHFGNISKRIGDKLLITATGSMLDELEGEIVEVSLDSATSLDVIASTEVKVHRAIYKAASALAVIHTHSPYAVVLSLVCKDYIEPVDSEGKLVLHRIPIIDGEIGSDELARNAASALSVSKAAVIRGHGPITRGNTLDEAFVYACCVEHSCKVAYLALLLKNPSKRRKR